MRAACITIDFRSGLWESLLDLERHQYPRCQQFAVKDPRQSQWVSIRSFGLQLFTAACLVEWDEGIDSPGKAPDLAKGNMIGPQRVKKAIYYRRFCRSYILNHNITGTSNLKSIYKLSTGTLLKCTFLNRSHSHAFIPLPFRSRSLLQFYLCAKTFMSTGKRYALTTTKA